MRIRNMQAEAAESASGGMRRLGRLMPGVSIFCLSTILTTGPMTQAYGQYGVADRVGEALENAGRNIRQGIQNAVDANRGPYAVAPYVVYDQPPLIGRVQARLQWEKLLAGATVELEVRDNGIAILRGEVASKDAKERAVLLARDTLGINQVIDELAVVVPQKRDDLDPLPETPAAVTPPTIATPPTVVVPPVVGPAVIRVRPARVRALAPVRSTTVIVQPPRVAPSPVPAPATSDVIIQP